MGDLSEHLSRAEVADHDGTPYPINQIDVEDPALRMWGETRLKLLLVTFEVIRTEAGNLVIKVISGYRDKDHQQRLVDAHPEDHAAGLVASPDTSQHPKGRALDIRHSQLSAADFHALVTKLFAAGKLPHLGGLGKYPDFIHIDVRPRPANGRLAQWGGTPKSLYWPPEQDRIA